MSEQNENLPTQRGFFSELDPFREFFRSPLRTARHPLRDEAFTKAAWMPAMDVSESKDGYAITMEVPGAKKEDINVECHDGVVTIKGEKRDEREEKGEHRHYIERSYGSFSRSFRLPPDSSEDIQASFKDGVLSVEITKQEEKKPRTVAIES